MPIKKIKITDLVPDDKNLNKGTERGKELIETSVGRFGAGRSVLIDKNNRIIAGNKTQEAAIAKGIKDVIIVETDGTQLVAVKRNDVDLDSREGREEMALADNATVKADLEWDTEQMEAIAEDFGIDMEAWDVDFDGMTEDTTEAEEDDFDEEQDEVKTVAKRGDIFELGNHRLMCGDSTSEEDVAKLMNGTKGDMVFTDPPYGVKYNEKNEFLNAVGKPMACTHRIENDDKMPSDMHDFWVSAFINLHKFTKERMAYYITAPQGGDLVTLLQAIKDSGFLLKHNIIWNKNNHVLGRSDYNYKHEPIAYGWKEKGQHHFYGGGKFKTSVWDIDKPVASKLHPTMKPVELVANCILDNSKEGDIILDTFGGSGSTLIAAEQLGRKCRMMELDPHYCDVIIARWEKLTGQQARKIEQ